MKIFVYGTLKRGKSNHGLLHGSRFLGTAVLFEHGIYSLGSYPGVEPMEGKQVVGELFEITEGTLAVLDRLEGVNHKKPKDGLYRRELVTVWPEGSEEGDKEECRAYVYLFNNRYGYSRPIIENGIWG